MYREQVIWIAPRATAFRAVCDSCLADTETPEAYLSAGVSGSLRLEAQRGWLTCTRGHGIRVERVHPALTGVIRRSRQTERDSRC
jgi:hypothetical protein